MSEIQSPASPPKNKTSFGSFMIGLFLIFAIGVWFYVRFTDKPLPWAAQNIVSADLSIESVDQRLLIAEENVAQLKRERSALQQKLSDAANRTNLLRDEVLGVSERAGLIEESIHNLSQIEHSAQDTLHINESILLLSIANERWQLSNDLAGAIKATELARLSIDSLKDPQWVNLRQTLAQELTAYRDLPPDPSAKAKGELDALEALLPQLVSLSGQGINTKTSEYGMTRLLNAMIRIQPSGQQTLISPSERSAAKTALELEITNARLAIQVRNSADFKASIIRINQWLARLYADTPALKEQRKRLLLIANIPLNRSAPLAGSSLAALNATLQGTRK